MNANARNGIRQIFMVGIAIKGIDGLLETVGGFLFYLISPGTLSRIVVTLTAHELSADPQDRVALFCVRATHALSSSTKLFGSIYLVGHGLLKVLLAFALVRQKLWAYPAALLFLGAFVGYQLSRVSRTHSVGLLALTLFDSILMALIWREYRLKSTVVENSRIAVSSP